MKKLILMLALAPVGALGGMVGGHLVKSPGPEMAGDAGTGEPGEADAAHAPAEPAAAEPEMTADHGPPHDAAETAAADDPAEYFKLDKQFVVPVVHDDRVAALMVVNLALEMEEGGGEIFEQEPKLRDEFLKVLFLHAQSGGFSGDFTEEGVMEDLRGALAEAARGVVGAGARSVLLTSIVRQDL